MKRTFLLIALFSVGGCQFDRSLGVDDGDGGSQSVDAAGPPWVKFVENTNPKVDILFMVDNSSSMTPMSVELTTRFNALVQMLGSLAMQGPIVDLQIGVVTSDYGAGATGAPGCQISPGGQQGKLQALGAAAPMTCKPPIGANYIKFNFGGPSANNLPDGQDLAQTFTCMASVGSSGCGFEHQLESVYAALRGNMPENAGFLRDDAFLIVVFLTNEDDSSAPLYSKMFDINLTAQYGYEDSFRSTRFGVLCDGKQPPYGDSSGPLSGCQPAPNPPGEEYDVSRYINFFSKPAAAGGVKTDPNNVILVAIDAPSDPFQVILSNPGTPGGMPFQQCMPLDEHANPPCVPVLQHSCQNQVKPVFFGDPAVRLNSVVNAAPHGSLFSICDADYTAPFEGIGMWLINLIGNRCIPTPVADVNAPVCVVEEVTANADGTTTSNTLPRCSSDGIFPCWDVKTQVATCANLSPQSLSLMIIRNNQPEPPNTSIRFYCN
jgi:hypothetical protein